MSSEEVIRVGDKIRFRSLAEMKTNQFNGQNNFYQPNIGKIFKVISKQGRSPFILVVVKPPFRYAEGSRTHYEQTYASRFQKVRGYSPNKLKKG